MISRCDLIEKRELIIPSNPSSHLQDNKQFPFTRLRSFCFPSVIRDASSSIKFAESEIKYAHLRYFHSFLPTSSNLVSFCVQLLEFHSIHFDYNKNESQFKSQEFFSCRLPISAPSTESEIFLWYNSY